MVQRLAVLLAAGVAPGSAMAYLAAAPGSGGAAARRRRLLRAVAEEAAAGGDATAAILRGCPVSRRIAGRRHFFGRLRKQSGAEGKSDDSEQRSRLLGRHADDHGEMTAWAALAASWRVAADSGAPVAAALGELADALRDVSCARRDIDVALAGPAATGRVVGLLPLVALGFGILLGFDVGGVLIGTVPGAVCLVGGCALMVAAQAWTRRLVRGAVFDDPTPGLPLDLLAVALTGGGSVDGARHAVLAALAECGLSAGPRAIQDAESVLALSTAAGVPAGRLLRSEASLARVRAAAAAKERAARLGVMLMLPLGVCVLPAFLLLGVAPMVIAVLLSTFGMTK